MIGFFTTTAATVTAFFATDSTDYTDSYGNGDGDNGDELDCVLSLLMTDN